MIYSYARFGYQLSISTNLIFLSLNLLLIFLKLHFSNTKRFPKLKKKFSEFDLKFSDMIKRNNQMTGLSQKKEEDEN